MPRAGTRLGPPGCSRSTSRRSTRRSGTSSSPPRDGKGSRLPGDSPIPRRLSFNQRVRFHALVGARVWHSPCPVRRVWIRLVHARSTSLRTQLGAARSLLASLASARQALGAAALDADGRGPAASTREQVSAAIAAYRAEAKLDDVLAGTWRQVSALMEERGLR